MRSATLQLGSATLTLLPERAVWWAERAALIIADPHFGKAATFRAAGIYVPHGTTAETLRRLDALVTTHRPQELIILGDFFHARPAQNPDLAKAFLDWRAHHPTLMILLIRGNHDRHAGDPPTDWLIASVDEPHELSGLILRHTPPTPPERLGPRPTLCGHLHPSYLLQGLGRERLKAPCFHLCGQCLMLPAFGVFTGTAKIQPDPGDQLWLVGEQALFHTRIGAIR